MFDGYLFNVSFEARQLLIYKIVRLEANITFNYILGGEEFHRSILEF